MKLKVSQIVGPDLATRKGCDNLFLIMEKSTNNKVILDFSDIASISRSFAHEYLIKKNVSEKKISEVNLSPFVSKMFEFVKGQNTTKKELNNDTTKMVMIS